VHFQRYQDRTILNDGTIIHCVFCVIHGQSGEDGVIQGFCEAYNLSYIGSNVVSSALCMDKVFTKIVAQRHNIRTPEFIVFGENEEDIIDYDDCVQKFGNNFFMKVANLGSSVGVYKIKSFQDYKDALGRIWRFGKKIIIEQSIENAREIEVAVFSDDQITIASDVLGEVKPNRELYEFYNYEAKYIDPNGAELIIPAKIDREVSDEVKEMAIEIYKAMGCYGLARVDFLLNEDGVFFNEINTLPGFTNISMYPKLFEVSVISYSQLITMLINSAFTRKSRTIDGLMRD
jgi:D-alanine-D-alanine ligase